MNVRHRFSTAFALAVLLLGAGCTGGDNTPFALETDESFYQQAKQLQRQGRNPEALTSYLKLIEKRGAQNAPESHLEAGIIYLHDIKNPVEAIHHFQRHLELQQLTGAQQARVRSLIENAKREFARTLPGRFNDEQAARPGGMDAVDRLQRENDELRAEIARLKGGAVPFLRTTRGPVEPVEVLPPPVTATNAEVAVRAAPPPPNLAMAGMAASAPSFGGRQPPTRPPGSSGPAALPPAGKRHTVAAGENLFRIAQKYGVKPEAIALVNRETLPKGIASPLKPGMELKVP
jgi:hypothetical protein